jgi:Arc/MetJ-type ribon-helix-helix transcriptional regulator
MGRPKKYESSRSRSFLLPSELLDQIEEAAEKRKKDSSDVVRELLEANIGVYLKESEKVWKQHMQKAIADAENDPDVCDLFTKFKGKKQLVLPLDIGLKKPQLLLLMEALRAYRDLSSIDTQEAEDSVHARLEELAVGVGVDQRTKDCILGLQRLFEEGELFISRDEHDDSILLKVREALHERLNRRELDDQFVKDLYWLIKKKRFFKWAWEEGGVQVYRKG